MRNGVKNAIKYVLPSFIAGTIFTGGAAWAGTNLVQAIAGTSSVQANGKTVSSPPKLVYNGTTYVQLYSIQHALINSGINATWDGNSFAMTIPDFAPSATDTTSPVLDGVYFTKGTTQPNTDVQNDLYQLQNVLVEIPTSQTGNQSFSTYISVDNETVNKPELIKEDLYSPDGHMLDSQTTNWTPTSNGSFQPFGWEEPITQAGYYTVMVSINNRYIGQGKIWAYDPTSNG